LFAQKQQSYATRLDIVDACQRVLTTRMKLTKDEDTLGLLVLVSNAKIVVDFEALNNTFEQMHSMKRYTPQRDSQDTLYFI